MLNLVGRSWVGHERLKPLKLIARRDPEIVQVDIQELVKSANIPCEARGAAYYDGTRQRVWTIPREDSRPALLLPESATERLHAN